MPRKTVVATTRRGGKTEGLRIVRVINEHPGRREHAVTFVEALADPKSRAYAMAQLDRIWSGKPAPTKPRALSVSRVKEIDAALYAIFATIR